MKPDREKAIVEVFPEEALLNHGLQVPVGRTDQPKIVFSYLVTPQALALIFLQGAQQLGLNLHGQLAYLVEEKGASGCRFKLSGLAFLRTHPLTNDRIAAANARARASASSTNRLSNDYGFEVAKARMVSKYTSSPSALITSLRTPLQNENATALDAYRLIYTLMDHDQLAAARSLFDKTAAQLNNTVYGILLNGELALKEKNYTLAHEAAESILDLIPSHYSAMRLAAESLEKLERYDQAAAILRELSEQRPKDAYVWYQLAEVHGLANNTAELHLSRIHYFIVTGQPERALKQIQFAKQSGTVSEHRLSLLKRDAELLKQQITEALG